MKQQNNDRLSDKTFTRLIVSSVLAILACLVCLCSTTWAWFTDSVSYQGTIKTAEQCLLSVSVYEGDTALDNVESGVTLKKDVVYTVKLSLPKDSGSGYCELHANGNKYRSDYLLRHENEQAETLAFTLTVSEDREVTFSVRWGIYAGESDVVNGTLQIP